jgi:hypothetical protein
MSSSTGECNRQNGPKFSCGMSENKVRFKVVGNLSRDCEAYDILIGCGICFVGSETDEVIAFVGFVLIL